jgi:hypothetical protein
LRSSIACWRSTGESPASYFTTLVGDIRNSAVLALRSGGVNV